MRLTDDELDNLMYRCDRAIGKLRSERLSRKKFRRTGRCNHVADEQASSGQVRTQSGRMINKGPMWLVYSGEHNGVRRVIYQPWNELCESGTLIDPETDDDMEMIGWTISLPTE